MQRIVGDPPRFIAAMQLGVTLTSLGIGALGEPVLSELFDDWHRRDRSPSLLAFLIITFMHVVVGELVPKGIALNYSERVRARRLDSRARLLRPLPAADLGPAAVERAGPAD